jgi:hypothetical protein
MLDLRTVVSILSKIFSAFTPTPLKPSFDWECKGKSLYQIIKNFLLFFEVFFFRKQRSVFRRTCNFLERTAKIRRVFLSPNFSSLFSKFSFLLFHSFSLINRRAGCKELIRICIIFCEHYGLFIFFSSVLRAVYFKSGCKDKQL